MKKKKNVNQILKEVTKAHLEFVTPILNSVDIELQKPYAFEKGLVTFDTKAPERIFHCPQCQEEWNS